jgi:predicted nucleotidyltransferase
MIVWRQPALYDTVFLQKCLAERLQNRVEQVFLIGSYARNQAHRESDIDLIVITPTKALWPERATEFADLRLEFGAMDIIVYTPDEWKRLNSDPTPYILHVSQYWIQII